MSAKDQLVVWLQRISGQGGYEMSNIAVEKCHAGRMEAVLDHTHMQHTSSLRHLNYYSIYSLPSPHTKRKLFRSHNRQRPSLLSSPLPPRKPKLSFPHEYQAKRRHASNSAVKCIVCVNCNLINKMLSVPIRVICVSGQSAEYVCVRVCDDKGKFQRSMNMCERLPNV